MVFEIAIVVGVLTLVYYLVTAHNSKINKFKKQFPGPPQVPIFGNSLDLNIPNEKLAPIFQFEWPKRYGPRWTFALGSQYNYFTSSLPSDIEKLLSSTSHIEKGLEYSFVAEWLGDGLLISGGQKWSRHRKMLTPSFHFKILDEFMGTFNEKSKVFVDILRKNSEGGKKPVEICQYITLCALDIICETAMGKPINAQLDGNSDYVKAIYTTGAAVQYRLMRPWWHPRALWYNFSSVGRQEWRSIELMHKFVENVIAERKKDMEGALKQEKRATDESKDDDRIFMKKTRTVALMDLLLEVQANDPVKLTDRQIREEIDTFMFEGHDTTSASLAWTVFLLGLHPEYQEKIVEELDEIFDDDKERPVTSADLTQMKYLEYCIKESLRLFPSVPFYARRLKKDLKLDDQVTVPAGFTFCLLTLNIHRNPEIFPDPEAFKPERFAPENANGRHPYAYVPFSAGPRNCIGQKFALMEEKVILAHLFRNFRVESLQKRENVVIMMELITRPKDGIDVKLTPR